MRALSRHGRDDFERVSEDVFGKSHGEVTRYNERFWSEGQEHFPPDEWARLVKSVEKGEKKRQEMTGLLEAAREFVGLFSETPEKLELRFNPPGTAGFPPTTVTRHDEERGYCWSWSASTATGSGARLGATSGVARNSSSTGS